MSTSLHLLTKTRFSTESRYLLESTSKRGLSNFSQYSAEMSHAVADAIVFSKSFARRLFRLSHARLRSTPESGSRAGYDGAKRKKGSKLHMAVDTLGHLLALHVTPANRDDRAETGPLAEVLQKATDGSVELVWADQGYTGSKPAKAAREQGITLEIIRLPQAKRGFVLLPRRWIVERSFA